MLSHRRSITSPPPSTSLAYTSLLSETQSCHARLTHEIDEENEKEIERHKQEISGHRHSWAPPSTPPKYRSIGFPDTQEIKEINREAGEMFEAKKARVETEATTVGNGVAG